MSYKETAHDVALKIGEQIAKMKDAKATKGDFKLEDLDILDDLLKRLSYAPMNPTRPKPPAD